MHTFLSFNHTGCTLFSHSVTLGVHFSLIQSHRVSTFLSFNHTGCTLFSHSITLSLVQSHLVNTHLTQSHCPLFSHIWWTLISLNHTVSCSVTLGEHTFLIQSLHVYTFPSFSHTMCTLSPHSVTPCVHFSLIQSHRVYTILSFGHSGCTLFFSHSVTPCTLFSRLVTFLSFSLNGYALFSRSATLGIHLSLIHWFSHTPLMLNTVLICFSLTLQNFQDSYFQNTETIFDGLLAYSLWIHHTWCKYTQHITAQIPKYCLIMIPSTHNSPNMKLFMISPTTFKVKEWFCVTMRSPDSQTLKPSQRLCQTDSFFFWLSMLWEWHIVFPNLQTFEDRRNLVKQCWSHIGILCINLSCNKYSHYA